MEVDDHQLPASSSQHSVSDAKLSEDSFNNNNHSGCTVDDVPDGHPDDAADGAADKPLKKGRKRKRHIYNAIRDTMEFYFSDANLSKDRFLMRLIEQDAEVPLVTFLSFNKIKSLCSGVEDIEKALVTSSKLRLSEDRSKVSRTADLASLQTRCPDDCTVYVEALPMNATHDWVRRIFEQYGPVAYVSLPKYRWSQRIKEFAFVEFESKAGVLKAMQAFAELGAVLNATGCDPDKLGSVMAYLREQEEEAAAEEKQKAAAKKSKKAAAKGKQKQAMAAAAAAADDGSVDEKPASTEESTSVATDAAAKDDDPEPLEKRRRLRSDPEPAAEVVTVSTDDAEETEVENSNVPAEDAVDEEPIDTAKSKVRRKKAASKQPQPAEGLLEASVEATLRITTKLEWKRLRNKYLNQQRERVKQMKKQLWLVRQKERAAGNEEEEQEVHPVSPDDASLAIDVQPEPEHSGNMNFYGANRNSQPQQRAGITHDGGSGGQTLFAKRTDSNAAVTAEGSGADCAGPVAVKQPLFSYEPGIIVQIHFGAPCVDVKDFKDEMRQHACVRYVDVREGDMCAFVRVAAGVEAPELCAKTAPLRADILQGEAERLYWQKIGADREQKLSKALRLKPKRGREKMREKLAVAAMQVNHVRFDD